jgi:MHS family proline/betaine transporter-like MFS transporter
MTTGNIHQMRRRVVAAGIAGNVMEWYDFAVYGYFARTIGLLFFPGHDPTTRLIEAYAVFAVGFLMRPLGAVVFGYIGDRVGRGPALLWSVVAMAVPTLVMGLLPTFHQIGIAAPILMVLCRMAQGLAVGGEYTGSAVFLAETAAPDRRGQAAAWAPFGAIAGILLGSVTATVVLNLLPLEFVQDWGWRIPFLLGVVVGGVGFLLRRRLSIDPPPARSGFPLVEAVHHHWTAIVQGVAISLINAIPFYISFVYILPWLRKYADLSARNAGIINSANMMIIVLVIPAAAWLSDRVGRKPVLVAAATGLTLLAWPLFAVMEIGEIWAVFVGQFGIALLIGIYAAVSPIALSELFPRGVRCSAVSITHNLSAGLAGGTAPMVAEWLISRTGYSLAPAVYVTLAAALSLIAALSLRSGYSALAAETVSIEPAIARA